jgi:hypothetical protein
VRQRGRIGAPDTSLPPVAGLASFTELVERLRLVEELERAIGPIKVLVA